MEVHITLVEDGRILRQSSVRRRPGAPDEKNEKAEMRALYGDLREYADHAVMDIREQRLE